MRNRVLLLTSAFATLMGCTPPPSREGDTAPAPAAPAETSSQPDAAIDRSRQTVYGTNEAKSPFERETVIRLNAVVQRSLDTINEFDGRREEILSAAGAAAKGDEAARAKTLKDAEFVGGLYERAAAALTDIKTAEKDIIASGEDYNASILAGMIDFVSDVEAELRKVKETLAESLSRAGGN